MPSPIAVVPYNFIQKRYDFNALLKRLIYLDYLDMHNLTKTEEGTLEDWVKVFKKCRYSSRYLIDADLNILGYWHFVSLTESYFKKAKKGLLLDGEIRPSSIYSLNKKGLYNIYFVSIVLLPKIRDTNTIIMFDNSFFDAIYDFAHKGVYFKEALLNAITPEGEKHNWGMHFVTKHSLRGNVYYMDFSEFLLKNGSERKDVLKLYSKRLL